MEKYTSQDDVQKAVRTMIDDAVSHMESEFSEKRTKEQRYYEGKSDVPILENRSRVTSTKVRDAIRAVKPPLMKMFVTSDRVVEFIPASNDAVDAAEEQSDFVSQKFWTRGGYLTLMGAFHDPLVKGNGYVKVYRDESVQVDVQEFSGATLMEIPVFEDMGELSDLEQDEATGLFSGTVTITKTTGKCVLEGIPPEDFFIDEAAKTLEDASICGHTAEKTVGDLVAMGFDYEEVSELDDGRDGAADSEQQQRRGYDNDTEAPDPTQKRVLVTEAYAKLDLEGEGLAQLYKLICGGSNYKILHIEPADDVPFAVFKVDHEPHRFMGRSLAEILMEDQDAHTLMIRGMLDNINHTNNPRLAVNDDNVNYDDLLNNEIGGVVRVKGNPNDKFREMAVPFTAGQTIGIAQYYDTEIEGKTGVTRASMGLNPDALQSTTKAAVDATVSGASGQVEVIARNLAETGVAQMFRLMLRLYQKHPDMGVTMKMNGEVRTVNPESWDAEADTIVNVGLGTNREQERGMALRETLAQQMQIYGAYGPENGLVTLTNIRNAQADILSLSGIKSAERYWQPMTPEREQQLIQAAQAKAQQQQQQQQQNPLAEAEKIKAMASIQQGREKIMLDGQKAMAEMAEKQRQFDMEDDRERDKMAQDLALETSRIIQSGGSVNTAAIEAEQNAPR